MTPWKTICAAVFLLLYAAAFNSTASENLRASAADCISADDQAGLHRSPFRLTNYGTATIHVFCPINFPKLQLSAKTARARFMINDQDTANNTNCYFSVRRQDGSEVAGGSAATSGVGLQSMEVNIAAINWNGSTDPVFVLECWLPNNSASGYTKMHFYTISKID